MWERRTAMHLAEKLWQVHCGFYFNQNHQRRCRTSCAGAYLTFLSTRSGRCGTTTRSPISLSTARAVPAKRAPAMLVPSSSAMICSTWLLSDSKHTAVARFCGVAGIVALNNGCWLSASKRKPCKPGFSFSGVRCNTRLACQSR